ncbi:MAG: ABC transporter ATP-binding protein [Planctomycetes bacterium]|nr:ABC transporter ATP-binding protein [Planctomycetota bacterium]
MALLEIEHVDVFYGAVQALRSVSLRVEQGEVVSLVGSNGAGKTTTLNAICGLVRPRAGDVRFDGQSIARVPTHELVRRGLVMAPEGRGIFPNLTVAENLDLGAYSRRDHGAVKTDLDRVLALFPRLNERMRQKGGTLSGGEQQMLAIGRALMSRPKLLLLDEPSLGLAPLLVKVIFDTIDAINREGVTVLLVEQNANAALKHSKRAYVLESGSIALEGDASQLRDDPAVKAAYLGE